MTAWMNPHPEKEIKSITFESKKIGIPVLVAITTGKQTVEKHRDKSTKSQTLAAENFNKEAKKYLKVQKYAEAEKLLKRGISTAWDYPSNYLNLGYLYSRQKKWNKAIGIYQTLLKAVPSELEAYYRIGKCYEAKGEYKKALEIYRKSLKADINQPDIMKALDEVKKKIPPDFQQR